MLEELKKFFDQKKILILGFGREGRSSYELIRRLLPEQRLVIADQREVEIDDANVEVVSGEGYLEGLAQYDVIMKSPGISLKNIDVSGFEEKITSQLELLLEFFWGQTIGVTGTKGKSTTSSLVYEILRGQGVKSLLLGNIGVPVFEHVSEIKSDMTLVLEMSSHQLEFMRRSPQIALLLNIYPEHLDHYRSFEAYVEAKCNIFSWQNEEDALLYGADEEMVWRAVKEGAGVGREIGVGFERGNVRLVGDFVEFDSLRIYDCRSERQLVGDYNLLNIMFALGVAEVLGLDMGKVAGSVNEFQGLQHRVEFVGEYDGVKYYDNAIGTVPQATMTAMRALGDVDTVIVGGMDRGLDYSELCEFLRKDNVRNVICMPETGYAIAMGVGFEKAVLVETMQEAVLEAKARTAHGKSCLLSPAAASYGQFKNFEEKGDLYQELVKE